MEELRCEHKKHAHLLDDLVIEVKCDSRLCGAGNGVVVLHRFNIRSEHPELIGTSRFADPARKQEEVSGTH